MNREQIAARLSEEGWLVGYLFLADIETLIREAEAAARAEAVNALIGLDEAFLPG